MPDSLPPEDEIARLRVENDRLRIPLHDAICRPLGVTPDSAVEFYSHQMAAEAAERRPRYGTRADIAERVGRALDQAFLRYTTTHPLHTHPNPKREDR